MGTNRMTWKEITKKYPNQWLGLTSVQYNKKYGGYVDSAIIKYADKTINELLLLSLTDKDLVLISTVTNSNADALTQVGVIE